MTPIDPIDPKLPIAWQKHPTYKFEIATLVNAEHARQPDDATAELLEFFEPEEIRLHSAFPGWFVSHDFKVDEFDPFMDVSSEPQDLDRVLSDLKSLQRSYFDQALKAMREFILENDFRSAQSWFAKLFAGHTGGFLTLEQRQQVVAQLQTTPLMTSESTTLHQAFLELERGFAVGAVLWQEIEYPYLETRFESPHNPVLTLIGREVVCENADEDEPVARGVLQLLEGNVLAIADWQMDFGGFEVSGTPFHDLDLVLDDALYTITEAELYDLAHEDDGL